MPRTTRLRLTRALEASNAAPSGAQPRWEYWAHLATIASSVVAVVAILAGVYQFRENLAVQRESLAIQAAAAAADRNAKAAEFFEKFAQTMSEYKPPKGKYEYERYIRSRNNKGLQFLNAIHSVSAGDEKWERVVFWELQGISHWLKKRQATCLSLTNDFHQFILKSVSDLPSNICYDTSEAE